MHHQSIALSALLLLCAVGARAQVPSMTFDQAAYVTCKEAQAMTPDARKALALYLADHAARHHGVTMPDDARGTQIAYLVRGGCTLAPDAYLFTVIDRAILAELGNRIKR